MYSPAVFTNSVNTIRPSGHRGGYPSFRTSCVRSNRSERLTKEIYREGPGIGPRVAFAINGLPLFEWSDPSDKVLGKGRIGFRQMAPLRAAYRNLTVERLP